MGSAARTIITSVRLSPAEAKLLRARFGGVPKALRFLVDQYLGTDPLYRTTKSVPSDPDLQDDLPEPELD